MDSFWCEYYSSVKEKKVEWLWYPYIPYGKITVLQGDPGEGKSTFILNVAALLTQGEPMPDETEKRQPQKVIYQCAEDNIEDTIKPRLLQAGADCEKVAFIRDEDGSLSVEDARLEEALETTGARMLILDPMQAYIGQDGDMQSATRMRSSMRKLAALAEKYHCAVVLVGHMNKASGGKQIYRGLGSIDIVAVARSVLMLERDPDNPAVRYVSPIKSSLAGEGDAIAFSFIKDHGFQWLGKCKTPEEDKTEPENRSKKMEFAKAYLEDILTTEDKPSSYIFETMKQSGISERTVRSAVKELGIQSYRKGKIWYMHMDKQQKI
jgi:KaiC/GvpD/RAD55 family RecA-like ATPase